MTAANTVVVAAIEDKHLRLMTYKTTFSFYDNVLRCAASSLGCMKGWFHVDSGWVDWLVGGWVAG